MKEVIWTAEAAGIKKEEPEAYCPKCDLDLYNRFRCWHCGSWEVLVSA